MALDYAAVPRDGLGPSAPPWCRCAECHAIPLLQAVQSANRCVICAACPLREPVTRRGGRCGCSAQVKEELTALGRRGGHGAEHPHRSPRSAPKPTSATPCT